MLLWFENAPASHESNFVNGEDLPETVTLVDTIASAEECLVSSSRNYKRIFILIRATKRIQKKCFGAPFWPMDKTGILLPVLPVDKNNSKVVLFQKMHKALEAGNCYEF